MSSRPAAPRLHLALRGAVLGAVLLLVLPWDLVLLGMFGVLGLCTAQLAASRG